MLITAFPPLYFRTLCRESISRPSGRLSHASWPCRTSSTKPAATDRRNQDSFARQRNRRKTASLSQGERNETKRGVPLSSTNPCRKTPKD